MDPEAEQQITRLQAAVAHLEHQYDVLNGVVVEQGRELARLRQQLQKLTSSVENIETDRIRADQRKPPHAVI